ncbi:hypothetical protein PTTG_04421 [Puccinia triticina 1-1 BBBD Race 1]|uniref:Uncharacterized protein n=2 Tax=Puccinia triticina TaxID=208348 RepID=A0A180GQQ8_PUCT1|nr:uncharacterized protein PtA15_6A87 [Puccinia triticina]OAV95167.1 hypothetical protein PTTG_04421 [Puccinia triticina 1-1 BBBD Race 1]WAQ85459.1 hypothetical protein PtA15_6A87 [Puccinia triticina]WAR55342.1 hypothetical protein PtB15_6B81 [Puccinia triticina]
MAGRSQRPSTDPIEAAQAAGLFTPSLDQIRPDSLRNLQSFFPHGNTIDPLPAALSALIKSKAEGRKKHELPRHFFARIFKTLIPVLKQGRVTHWWEDKEHYRGLVPFRLDRDLLPRLRRRIAELPQVMYPTKMKSEALVRAASQHLHQISIDATQLKISVCLSWDPSKSKVSEDKLIDLPLYYYPDLPWGIDHVRDSIAELFETYTKSTGAGMVPVKNQEEIHLLLALIDEMIRDLESPRSAMQTKWRLFTREIEIMDHTLNKCLKPEKVRISNPLEGLEDQKHLEIDQWRPREQMAPHEVRYVESTLPIFRLSRMLLNKLSRPTNTDSLTARMTLEELNAIYLTTDRIEEDLRVLAQLTLQVRRRHGGHCLRVNAERIKKILPLLKKHFDSLGPEVDQAEIKRGKQWCQSWQTHYDLAVEKCLECCGFNDTDQWETDDSEDDE